MMGHRAARPTRSSSPTASPTMPGAGSRPPPRTTRSRSTRGEDDPWRLGDTGPHASITTDAPRGSPYGLPGRALPQPFTIITCPDFLCLTFGVHSTTLTPILPFSRPSGCLLPGCRRRDLVLGADAESRPPDPGAGG